MLRGRMCPASAIGMSRNFRHIYFIRIIYWRKFDVFYSIRTLFYLKALYCIVPVIAFQNLSFGGMGIHKPCGHWRGRGLAKLSILLHKLYIFSKMVHEVRGRRIRMSKIVHLVYGYPLHYHRIFYIKKIFIS